jgi:16S rRNA (uracil1498-N3)-methyltransferase
VNGDSVAIEGESHRHLAKALRARPGDRFLASDGEGLELLLEMETVGRDASRARIVEERRLTPGALHAVTIAVAPPKGDRLDVAIEKVCEIGVGRIVPLVTERSVVRIGAQSPRLERWRRIARAAMVQSGQVWAARVDLPLSIDALLAERAPGPGSVRALLAHPEPGAVSVRGALEGIARGGSVVILVGPEGGFSDDEALRARRAGAIAVSLGATRLRTETAAVVAAALAADALAGGT